MDAPFNWPIQPIPAVMTTEEVAELLRCSVEAVGRYVHRHELEAIQIGRERRFRGVDVLDFVNSRPTSCRGSSSSKGKKPRLAT